MAELLNSSQIVLYSLMLVNITSNADNLSVDVADVDYIKEM